MNDPGPGRSSARGTAGEAGGVVPRVEVGVQGSEEEVEAEDESMVVWSNEVAVKQSVFLILTLVDEAIEEKKEGGRKSGL